MASNNRDYLGIGWKFPLQVTPAGAIARARYEQRVEESIYLILGTAPGELVFAPNNAGTISLVTQAVRRALTSYERRIDVLSVAVESPEDQPNLLLIRVSYRIRSNNAMGNLVYPFYIREAA